MCNCVLLTGAAGFIGYHTAIKLSKNGYKVIGIDNLSDYYDVQLKKDRLSKLNQLERFEFFKIDLKDKKSIDDLFYKFKPDYVINLAAQAGVRYSIENPSVYIDSNIVGFFNILEACRNNTVKHLLYASSSSVYGGNKIVPFSTDQKVDFPVSLYAATKKSNELMAHSYSHLYKIPTTGLRFFTVYGEWGRPDMAYFLFTKAIINKEPINIYNYGNMERDFTYIDDIVEGIFKLLTVIPQSRDENIGIDTTAPYRVYNLGNNSPVKLERFISVIEKALGLKAKRNYLEMQAGDVLRTYADVSALEKKIEFKPSTSIEEGINRFVEWYKEYYDISNVEG